MTPMVCEPCKGSGEFYRSADPCSVGQVCHYCGGEGFILECEVCHEIMEPRSDFDTCTQCFVADAMRRMLPEQLQEAS